MQRWRKRQGRDLKRWLHLATACLASVRTYLSLSPPPTPRLHPKNAQHAGQAPTRLWDPEMVYGLPKGIKLARYI